MGCLKNKKLARVMVMVRIRSQSDRTVSAHHETLNGKDICAGEFIHLAR